LKSLNKNSDELLENVYGGEFGTRGEAYVAAQVVLMALVALGGIPVIGGALNFVLGPGLILVGAAVVLNGVTEMGSTLSPWPVPAEKGELITTGIFSKIRHPLYAGVLAICAGLSVATDSPTRLLLTAALWYVLELKSDYEEKQLKQAYTEYGEYMNEVPGKFFPQEILDVMPWNKKKDVN
jgi:protein-S-isoprenylcysteine O-methyltransferase Ste14